MTIVHGPATEEPSAPAPVRRDTAWQEIEAGRVRSPRTALAMARRFAAACREADTSVTRSLIGLLRYRARGRWIWAHPGTRIRGLENLETHGLLKIGIDYADISHPEDKTWLRIDGRMVVGARCKIGRGSRIHVGPNATLKWADGVWGNANILIHISEGLEVGEDCLLGWASQFSDDHFHSIEYDGKCTSEPEPIRIGNHVWIGNRASIGRGVEIADGCVVAAGSIVTQSVLEPNCLVAGMPARVIRRDISWH